MVQVLEYLTETLGSCIRGVGDVDRKVDKRTEAEICEAFVGYVVGQEGDVDSDYFLWDEGDVVYVYNGRYYEKMDEMGLATLAMTVMRDIEVGLVYQMNSYKKVAEICVARLVAAPWRRFRPDRRYVIFDNGVLDTGTMRLDEHSMRYKTDIVLHFSYAAQTTDGLWSGLVEQTIPDEGMRTAFQMFCGGFLADRNRFKIEYMCLMVGRGRNGKSLLCEAVTGLFGDDLVSSYSPEDLFKSSQSEYRLADINGKLANYADDVSNRDFSGGDFKRFISGAKFQGRHIYGRPFMVTRIPLMLCCVNEIPATTDDTNGHFRRILPILCPNQIADADVDVTLPQKLQTVERRQAIFNWLLEGYRALVATDGKITISDSIKAMKEDIKNDSNSARRWLRENGWSKTGRDMRWMAMREIMADYQEYCKAYSEFPKSSKSVANMLKELGFEKKRKKDCVYYLMGQVEPELEVVTTPVEEDLPF